MEANKKGKGESVGLSYIINIICLNDNRYKKPVVAKQPIQPIASWPVHGHLDLQRYEQHNTAIAHLRVI
jgi:hypothetical protein